MFFSLLPLFAGPDWARDAVIYHVFPDRFYDSDKTEANQPNGQYTDNYMGGDFQGIINKLDYLKELGVTCILLGPPFESGGWLGYGPDDYFTMESNFGGSSKFLSLVTECQNRNMKIMIDHVPNHFSQWAAAGNGSADIKNEAGYTDGWFYNYAYTTWGNSPWNHTDDGVRNYHSRALRYWASKGVNGARLDHPKFEDEVTNNEAGWTEPGLIPHIFWQNVNDQVKYSAGPFTGETAYSDFYFIGECVDSEYTIGSYIYDGEELDGNFNFGLRSVLTDWANNTKNAKEVKEYIAWAAPSYASGTNWLSLHLSNHDSFNGRFISDVGTDEWKLRMIALFQLTWDNIPTIYSGDELALTTHERSFYDWTKANFSTNTTLGWYKKLCKARRVRSSLRRGGTRYLVYGDVTDALVYSRWSGSEKTIVVINNKTSPQEIWFPVSDLEMPAGTKLEDFMQPESEGGAVEYVNSSLWAKWNVAGHSGAVLCAGGVPKFGTANGTIRKKSDNSPLQNAKVSVTNGAYTGVDFTDSQGNYLVEYVPTGEYSYICELSSYEATAYSNLTINDSTATTVNFQLSIDTTPPAIPQGVGASAGNASVTLFWAVNSEIDLAGYNLYKSTAEGSGYSLSVATYTETSYTFTGLTNDVTYYFVLKSVDINNLSSAYSSEASGLPGKVTVIFRINMTGQSPSSVYIAGNQPELGNWSATAAQMTSAGGGWYSRSVDITPGAALQYKYVMNGTSWESNFPTTSNNRELTIGTEDIEVSEKWNIITWEKMSFRGLHNGWANTYMVKSSSFVQTWHYTLFPTAADGNSQFKFDPSGAWTGNNYSDDDAALLSDGEIGAALFDSTKGNLEVNLDEANVPWIASLDTDGGNNDKKYSLSKITSLSLVGEGFGAPAITWTPQSAANLMGPDSADRKYFYKTVKLVSGQRVKFKFAPDSSWTDPIGNGWSFGASSRTEGPDASSGTARQAATNANLTYTPDSTGLFQFRFNIVTGEYSINPVKVIINEIFWSGEEGKPGAEWIELKNVSTTSVSLYDWQVTKDQANTGIYRNTSGKVVSPGGFFLVSEYGTDYCFLNVSPDEVYGGEATDEAGFEIPDDSLLLRLWAGEINYDLLVDTAGSGGTPPAGTTAGYSMEREAAYGDGSSTSVWHPADFAVNIDTFSGYQGTPKAENIVPIPPAAITGLSAFTGEIEGRVRLEWSAPKEDGEMGSRVEGYLIKYNTSSFDSGSFSLQLTAVSTITLPSAPGGREIIQVTGLSAGVTYYFAIKSYDEIMQYSPMSVTPLAFAYAQVDVTVPSSITDLQRTETGGKHILLTWTAPGDDGNTGTANTYDIRYATFTITLEADFLIASQAADEPAPQLAGGAEAFVLSGLLSDTTYYAALRTADELSNYSWLSNMISTRTLDITPPLKITTLSALTGSYEGEIFLSWLSPSEDLASGGAAWLYDMKYTTYSFAPGGYAGLYSLDAGTLPITPGEVQQSVLTGFMPGLTYYFGLKSADEMHNYSEVSDAATVYIPDNPPTTVTGLTVSDNASGNTLNFSWTENPEPDIEKYRIYRATYSGAPGTKELLLEVLFPAATCQAAGFTDNLTYYFILAAKDRSGLEGNPSEEKSVFSTDLLDPPVLTGLAVLNTGNGNELSVSWSSSPAVDLAGYNIYRSTYNGNYVKISTAPGNGFTDTGLTDLTTYFYRVTAFDEVPNESVFPDYTAAFPQDTVPPGDIQAITALAYDTGERIRVLWNTSSSEDFTGYLLRYSTSGYPVSTSDGEALYTGTGAAAEHTGLTNFLTYYYKLFVYDEVPNYSAGRSTGALLLDIIPPSLVTDLASLTGENSREIILRWTAPGEDGSTGQAFDYRLKYATYSITDDQEFENAPEYINDWSPRTPGQAEEKIVSQLESGTTYYFLLKTRDTSGNYSLISGSASAKTMDNLLLNVTARASSVSGTGKEADKVVDISTATFWESDNGTSQWIIFDPGEARDLNRLGLIWGGVYAKSYTFSVSNDSAVWFNVYNSTTGAGGQEEIVFPAITARYLKISCTEKLSGTGYTLADALVSDNGVVPDETLPNTVDTVTGTAGAEPGEVNLQWTAPGDDGTYGMATSYLVRYSTGQITNQAEFESAATYYHFLIPKPGGNTETLMITGLVPGTSYFFSVAAQDERGNRSSITFLEVLTQAYPGIVITKTADREMARPGEQIRYTLTFGNYSGAAAHNVILEDKIPQDTDYVPETLEYNSAAQTDAAGDDSAEYTDDKIRLNIGELPAGTTSRILKFTVEVK